MDAPLVLYQHLLLSTTCQQCRRARWIKAPGPGMAGTHGVTWKKRDHPSENHSHTHTHMFAQSGLQHTPSEKEKRGNGKYHDSSISFISFIPVQRAISPSHVLIRY